MAVFLRGSSFYLKVRRGGRQVLRSLNTTDKREANRRAKDLLRSLETATDTGADTNAPGGTGTLRAYFEQLIRQIGHSVEQGHLRPSYQLDMQSLWNAHLSRFAGRLVDLQLNRAVIEYLDSQSLSVARRRKTHTLFRNLATLAGIALRPHRFQSARPPKEKRPLSVAQLRRCKEECLAHPHPVAKLIYLAAVTGARIGEIMALMPADIGPDCISISKTKCRKTGAVVSAKTRNCRRVIPVSPQILATVQRCVGYEGKEWFPVWRAIRKRAGLGSVGIHVLRHSWATHALASGVTPKAVSLALGHASISFTEAQYARFLTADQFKVELAAFNR